MTAEQFELTRTFLKKYSLHFAETTAARLGYAIDDRFYGLESEGHLARFRRMMDELTLEDVNAAIKRHWQYENLTDRDRDGRRRLDARAARERRADADHLSDAEARGDPRGGPHHRSVAAEAAPKSA